MSRQKIYGARIVAMLAVMYVGSGIPKLLAEEAPLTRVAIPIAIAFDPTSASCAFRREDRLFVTRGLLVKEGEIAGEPPQQRWLVGCPAPPDGEKISQTSAIIERAIGPSAVRIAADDFLISERVLDGEDEARQHLVKQREILASYGVQIKAQEVELNKLRAKADTMGQQGSIGELEKRVADNERSLEAALRDKLNLETSLKSVRVGAAPANAGAVEVEITKQLAELAQAARVAEASESQRSSAGVNPIGEKMQLIEQTRFDDIDKIRDELVRMRNRRQKLEKALQGDVPSPLDYE